MKYKYPNRSWVCTVGKLGAIWCNAVNTLIEGEFVDFIVEKMKDREKMIVNQKKLSVEATKEFAELFTKSLKTSRKFIGNITIECNGKFYQYLRSERKRTYKEIENDNDENRELVKSLKIAKEKLENELLMMSEELELIKNRERDHINMD